MWRLIAAASSRTSRLLHRSTERTLCSLHAVCTALRDAGFTCHTHAATHTTPWQHVGTSTAQHRVGEHGCAVSTTALMEHCWFHSTDGFHSTTTWVNRGCCSQLTVRQAGPFISPINPLQQFSSNAQHQRDLSNPAPTSVYTTRASSLAAVSMILYAFCSLSTNLCHTYQDT